MSFSNDLVSAKAAEKPAYIEQIRQAALILDRAGAPEGAKQAGEMAPDFTLTASSGASVTLSHLLRDGPVVVSFYRGEWCPFCRVELDGLLAAQPLFAARGATLLLISQETPSARLTAEIATLGDKVFLLLDKNLGAALNYGLVYMPPRSLRQYYLDVDFDIPKLFGLESWLTPLPADLLIATDGRISMSFVDADFTIRLDPVEMLEALNRLPA